MLYENKAVVLYTFVIKIESVKYKEFVKYFSMLRRKWWGNNKEGDRHPQQWKRREVREEEKKWRRRLWSVVLIYSHGGWSKWLGRWLSTCTTIPRARGREARLRHSTLMRRIWLKENLLKSNLNLRMREVCLICAPKQALQFAKFFRTRFGGWLFVYPWKVEERNTREKAKIKPYELNQYNPYTKRNGVNAKPVFWYNQSQEISMWFCFQGWPGAKAVSNHLTMPWFMSIVDK
jgi:hypothetical protein